MLPSRAMAETRELSLSLRAFLKAYRWRTIEPVPVASLTKPISQCKVAIVSSAGFVVPGDEPFSESMRGGDFSFRVIPADTDLQALEEHHRSDSFSHAGLDADRNMGLPLDRLHEFAADGTIGEVAPTPHLAHGLDHRPRPARLPDPACGRRPARRRSSGCGPHGARLTCVHADRRSCTADHRRTGHPHRLHHSARGHHPADQAASRTLSPLPPRFPPRRADNVELQTSILRALLTLVNRTDVPVLESFQRSNV